MNMKDGRLKEHHHHYILLKPMNKADALTHFPTPHHKKTTRLHKIRVISTDKLLNHDHKLVGRHLIRLVPPQSLCSQQNEGY